MLPDDFLERFDALPDGHAEGTFDGQRYRVAVHRSDDGKRSRLFAEALQDTDIVSFNLFRLADGRVLLKPCEMPAEKVHRFVSGFEPDR